MTTPFERFAGDLCALVGCAPPALEADPDGEFVFQGSEGGVRFAVSHRPATHRDEAIVHVVFGPLPSHAEAEAMRNLLRTNFQLRLKQRPAFGLNEATGDIVLRYAVSLASESVSSVWMTLQFLSSHARRWRESSASLAPHFADMLFRA